MKELIEQAMGLIQDLPEEQSKLMYDILRWEDDLKVAFIFAYQLLKKEE